ncbi:hypothetical protein Cal7507_0478 [Calothrix sp. PCC 7507]|nr:hypothetical protein Cal7507_0478 [Calothrix sp. PCC 7507]
MLLRHISYNYQKTVCKMTFIIPAQEAAEDFKALDKIYSASRFMQKILLCLSK